MNPAERHALTKALAKQVAEMAADLRAQILAPGTAQERARRLHAEERVGDDFELWTDLLSRRAAVLWVLKTVYVRVLEDRGLLSPGRILDPEAQQLFEKLAPNLGESAFLSWVWRDLASPRGGLPELFAAQPAEVAVPSSARSRSLLELWRRADADTGFRWSFTGEVFAGELMGDLYQELDPVVKDRYALCQTQAFVRDFMLARTLEPAIEEYGADAVRVLDPACGSGHFLLDALRRLVEATAAQHADWPRRRVVDHALERVVGLDLNDYACALARSRLVMTAAELAGVESLAEAASFHPHIYWADGLEQIERDPEVQPEQMDLLDPGRPLPPRASLTRPAVRAVLRPLLMEKFDVVVGNPPYIAERDEARKAYHREKIGKRRRFVSAYREYSLAAPFTERCLQLATPGGHVGLIVGNSFMKREFGKPLIEEVLAAVDLALVVDSSQAYIPHHGTPTVMLFARNRPPKSPTVRAVMGRRGETGTPEDPTLGKVWSSIVAGWAKAGFENEFISVADVARDVLDNHPWTVGAGGALRIRLEEQGACRVRDLIELPIGRAARIAMESVFLAACDREAKRRGLNPSHFVRHYRGSGVRDWVGDSHEIVWLPYSLEDGQLRVSEESAEWIGDLRALTRHRAVLANRATFQGDMAAAGRRWYEYMQFTRSLVTTDRQISFANVATHNHFAYVRGRYVFNSKAPVIKLPPGATEDDHLVLLGLLNSSTACFWMKQVFQARAAGGIGRGLEPEDWMERYEHDGSKLQRLPLPTEREPVLPYARELDRVANLRAQQSATSILKDERRWGDSTTLQGLLSRRRESDLSYLLRMVSLQEELDWLCYGLYGLTPPGSEIRDPAQIEGTLPALLPWALARAERDSLLRSMIARGEEPPQSPTAWFRRHRWEPAVALPDDVSPAYRTLVERRRAMAASIQEVGLIEDAEYKRRWFCPDYQQEEREALSAWLADRIEEKLEGRSAKPQTVAAVAASLESDQRLHAVAELLTGRRDYRLADVVADHVESTAVPNHPFHVYRDAGLDKRAAWERTWEQQRKEGAGPPAKVEVPPMYGRGDFSRGDYWPLRGKLDVAKERFIAFTELPGRGAGETLYGWAGWTPLERLKALLALDEICEDEGHPLGDRIALLDSAWRLLPDVMRDDPATGARLKAELQALVGADGPARVLLDEWKKKFPPPGTGSKRKPGKTAVPPAPDQGDTEGEDD